MRPPHGDLAEGPLRLMLAAAAALILALSAFAQEVETTGNLVLIGGGAKPPEAMRKFVELAGGPEALIVVLPTASSGSVMSRTEAGSSAISAMPPALSAI